MPKTISCILSQTRHSIELRAVLFNLIAAIFLLTFTLYSAHAETVLRKVQPTPAPNLSFLSKNGASYSLNQWKGKVVVVNLWATWCAPCITEMPSLNQFAARYRDKGVSVIPVSIGHDSERVIKNFYTQHGLGALHVARDPNHDFLRGFGVGGLPSSFIIDKQGNIVGRIDGATDWNNVQLNAFIKFVMG